MYIKSIKTIEHTRPKYSKNLIDSVFNRVSTSPRVKIEQQKLSSDLVTQVTQRTLYILREVEYKERKRWC